MSRIPLAHAEAWPVLKVIAVPLVEFQSRQVEEGSPSSSTGLPFTAKLIELLY